jgi:hypothetical protein
LQLTESFRLAECLSVMGSVRVFFKLILLKNSQKRYHSLQVFVVNYLGMYQHQNLLKIFGSWILGIDYSFGFCDLGLELVSDLDFGHFSFWEIWVVLVSYSFRFGLQVLSVSQTRDIVLSYNHFKYIFSVTTSSLL